MWLLITCLAAEPLMWVDPEITFPGPIRLLTIVTNPTTAHAVVLLEGIAVAEVPPRGRLQLRLPLGTYQRVWRTPEGSLMSTTPLTVSR